MSRRDFPLAVAVLFCGAALGCAGMVSRGSRDAIAPGSALVSSPVAEQVGVPGREPMIVEHPGGYLFVAGYGANTPSLWKSADGGKTWAKVDVGTVEAGAIGNSDVDLAVGPDGTLYFATMVYDPKANEGVSISIGVSADTGMSWHWTLLSKTRFDDRPWVRISSTGSAHVIWNDGEGVSHAVSRDRGRTWKEKARISPRGGSSHLAMGPNATLAVRITPTSASGNKYDPGVDYIAVSRDDGENWRVEPAPGARDWGPVSDERVTPRWVEPMTWDDDGSLYSLWTGSDGVTLARSRDYGRTWQTWSISNRKFLEFFPYLTSGGRGRLAATWFRGPPDSLTAHVAVIEVPIDRRQLTVIEAAEFQPEIWNRYQGKDHRSTGGEYLALTFLRDGTIGLVTPIQNPALKRFGFSFSRLALTRRQ